MKNEIVSVEIDADGGYHYPLLAWVYRSSKSRVTSYEIRTPARFIRVSQLMRALLRKIKEG